MYEVPYDTTAEAARRNRAYREQLESLLAGIAGATRSRLFMRLAGASDEDIAGARGSHWPGLEKLAHTLAYDAACYGPPPVDRLRTSPGRRWS